MTLQRYFIKAVLLLDQDPVKQDGLTQQAHFIQTGSDNRPTQQINTNARGSQIYTATHDGATLYSSISFHVDEFKLNRILKNVITQSDQLLWDLSHTSAKDDEMIWGGDEHETMIESERTSESNALTWLTNIEIFEMMDSAGSGLISFREFCALIYLVAAVESQQLLKCLYDHGVLLFDIVGGGQHYVSGERAKTLARLIGISESVIDDTAEEICGFNSASMVGF